MGTSEQRGKLIADLGHAIGGVIEAHDMRAWAREGLTALLTLAIAAAEESHLRPAVLLASAARGCGITKQDLLDAIELAWRVGVRSGAVL